MNTEDYHIRKTNVKKFRFRSEDENYTYVGENLGSFERSDKTVECFSKVGFIDIKCLTGYDKENNYFKVHQKYIPIEEYTNSTQNDELKCF